MAKIIDLLDKRFGRLTVIGIAPKTGTSRSIRWNCLCDCGREYSVVSYSLLNGVTKECRDCSPKAPVKHGRYKSPEYFAWMSLKQRCTNKNHPGFSDYGERGISVCKEWMNSFKVFLLDMGQRPSTQHSIDRIDNDKDYGPDNCRWATPEEQQNNRRNNQRVEVDGRTMTVTQAARNASKNPQRVFDIMRKGIAAQTAVEMVLASST